MRKLVIFLSILTIVGVTLTILVQVLPQVLYNTIVRKGIDNQWIHLPAPNIKLLKGQILAIGDTKFVESNWKIFHFTHFMMPFPLHHPMYMFLPYIAEVSGEKELRLGVDFIDPINRENLGHVSHQGKQILDWPFDEHRIFALPLFKNWIVQKKQDIFWLDLWALDLSPKPWAAVFKKDYDYRDLVYKLFIYISRHKFFPNDMIKFSYYPGRDLGVVLFKSDNHQVQDEFLYVKDGVNSTRKLLLRTRLDNPTSAQYRDLLISTLQYRESGPESIFGIYADYQRLDYRKKIDQEGMTYLYIAWSHTPNDVNFLREMIQYLEKGKGNFHQLNPLYEYAYRHYGTTLSSVQKKQIETPDAKLKRKVKEEDKKEYDDEVERPVEDKDPPDHRTRIKQMVKEAKEKKINTDEQEDRLIIEN
jgi:hypothetical protein